MWYLTDNPETATDFLPTGESWTACTPDALDTSMQDAWRIWGTPRDEVYAAGDGDAGVVIIDTAPESQFDALTQALKENPPASDSLNAIALAGARFRGQRNRPWTALRGNLHYTAIYTLDVPVAQVETGLTLLPVVAAAQAIEKASDGMVQPRIKWVNDLFFDGAKVAGVLTSTQIQGSVVQRAVFGIGINVAQAPKLDPTPFVPRAGDLSRFQITLPHLLQALIDAINAGARALRSSGSAPLLEAYRYRAAFLGKPVTIWPDDLSPSEETRPLARGRVLALHPDLSLSVEGHPERVRKGRMAFDAP